MRIFILILGFSVISSFSVNPKEKKNSQNPEPDYKVAIHFINRYADFCNNLTSEIEIIEWVNDRQDVTKDFKTELNRILSEAKKQNPNLGLGFDPILNAQDCPDEFEIDKKDSEYIVVKGVEWSDFRVTIKLKFEAKQWLVAGSGIVNILKNKRIER